MDINNSKSISKNNYWWFIPDLYLGPMRKLEGFLRDARLSGDKYISYEDALDIICVELNGKSTQLAESILERFIGYYNNIPGVLDTSKPEKLRFCIASKSISDYKKDIANARLLLEEISVSGPQGLDRVSLYGIMHKYIVGNQREKLRTIYDDEKSLEQDYADRFKRAIKILVEKKIVKKIGKRKTAGGMTVDCYVFSAQMKDNPHDIIRAKEWAVRLLEKRLLEINTDYSPTNEKIKKRLELNQKEIHDKLSKLQVNSTNDRSVLHWYHTFLVLEFSNEDRSLLLKDFITYIRYNNICYSPIPVKAGELSQWEDGYIIWANLLSLIGSKDLKNILPIYIDEGDFRRAARRIIRAIDNLLGDAEFSEDKPQILSLYYVKATIKVVIGHKDAEGDLEYLFNYVVAHSYPQKELDLCLIINKLCHISCNDTFEYSSKARKWLFVINNQTNISSSFDIQCICINIYLHLLGMTPDNEESICGYQKKILKLFENTKKLAKSLSRLYELITYRYLYLLYLIDDICYIEASRQFAELWDEIKSVLALAGKDDPRPYIFMYGAFHLAATYLNDYIDFGVSLALLSTEAYIHQKKLGVKENMSYYYLLEGLGEFLKGYDDNVSLRVKTKIEYNYPEKYQIDIDIARQLLDRGKLHLGLEYAMKAEKTIDKSHPNNLDNLSYYLDIKLTQIKPLLILGHIDKAKEIFEKCGLMIDELKGLYPSVKRSCILAGVINLYEEIRSEYNREFYLNLLGLDYVITNLKQMNNIPIELKIFYNKWHQFYSEYKAQREDLDTSLLKEFETSEFVMQLREISVQISLDDSKLDISPIEDYEIEKLSEKLQTIYRESQVSFLPNDNSKSTDSFKTPTFDMVFEIFNPKKNTEIFIESIKCDQASSTLKERSFLKELELYHFITRSEYASQDDALMASKMFIDKIKDGIALSDYENELAAEVYYEIANLIAFDDFDNREKFLNQATVFIIKDGDFVSKKGFEIYLRILLSLCDIYEYQIRPFPELVVESAIDYLQERKIHTLEAAKILGVYAQWLKDEGEYGSNPEKRTKSNFYYRMAIDILKDCDPQTDEIYDYINLFIEELN